MNKQETISKAIAEVLRLAAIMALEAPKRRPKYSVSVYVRWELMEEIRAALTEAGIDLDAARVRMNELIKESNK